MDLCFGSHSADVPQNAGLVGKDNRVDYSKGSAHKEETKDLTTRICDSESFCLVEIAKIGNFDICTRSDCHSDHTSTHRGARTNQVSDHRVRNRFVGVVIPPRLVNCDQHNQREKY